MLDEYLAADPLNAEALHLIGLVELQQGNHVAAADGIARAMELDPSNVAMRANLGRRRGSGAREGGPCFCLPTAFPSILGQIPSALRVFESSCHTPCVLPKAGPHRAGRS